MLTAAIICPASAAPVSAATGPPLPPDTGLLFGGSIARTSGETAGQAFARLESQIGRPLAVERTYSDWDAKQPIANVIDDGAHGRIPLLSIRPRRLDGTIVSWATVASGAADADIRTQADALRDSAIAMVLIFHHEPEYAAGFGTSAEYVAAFRHYVAVFRGEQATNVAFGFVLGAFTYGNPTPWYPGDDVVDWLGADAYNFNACVAGMPPWRSLAQAAQAFYQWASVRGKPLMLAEWGSAEDENQPGRKAAWFADAANTLAAWPQIKAVAYFDRIGTCDWRIDTSASSLAAFQTLARSSLANGAASASLVPGTAVAPAPLAEAFDLSRSTGADSTTGSGIASWRLDPGDGSVPITGTGQPTTVAHTYAAGHWTAALTVTDTIGHQATTTAAVISAPAPAILEGSASNLTSSSATLPAWINPSGLAGSYYFQWGKSAGYEFRSTSAPLATVDAYQGVALAINGLRHGTRYHWRVVATTAAGTTYGPDRSFSTIS